MRICAFVCEYLRISVCVYMNRVWICASIRIVIACPRMFYVISMCACVCVCACVPLFIFVYYTTHCNVLAWVHLLVYAIITCMYVCMRVCVCAFVRVCICSYSFTILYTTMCLSGCTHEFDAVGTFVYACVRMCVCAYVRMYVCACLRIFIGIYYTINGNVLEWVHP